MLDFLEKTVRTAANVATLPVSVAADVVTLGGALNERGEPYTVSKGRRVLDDASDLLEDIAG